MKKLKLLLLFGVTVGFLNAVQQISQQDGTADFDENISVKAYDKFTGEFYVGTAAANGDYTMAKAARGDAVFTPLAKDLLAPVKLTAMALLKTEGVKSAATYIPFNGPDSGSLRVLKLEGLSVPVTLLKFRKDVVDPNGICDANGNPAGAATPAGLFTKIAAGYNTDDSKGYVFLRVKGDTGVVATDGDGILAYRLDTATDTLTKIALANDNAAALNLAKGNSQFLRPRSAALRLAIDPVVNDMYWDEELKTLFVCGSVTTALGANRHSAIVKVKINTTTNVLEISAVLPDNVDAANDNTTIFASNCTGARRDPRILKIRTMKTSTGKDYLIVNGGIANTDAAVGNKFYALRYRDDSGTGEIVANDKDGTQLADGFARTGAGTVNVNLKLDGANAGSLVVGGENAPWQNLAAQDMQVIGDTVYVCQTGVRDANNDPGVWASTAMFDNDGVIIGWTKWERVYVSEGNTANDDGVILFSVDAKSNQIWKVGYTGGGAPKVVKRTEIKTTNFANNSLQTKLRSDLSDGCSCVLDLQAGTPGLELTATYSANNSFVLFGGIEKVAFARTSYNTGAAHTKAVSTDFTPGANYKITTLPAGAGVVRSLGYSRKILTTGASTQGYFFAGTDAGLYVYAESANSIGYNTRDNAALTALNANPFDDNPAGTPRFSWQRMAADIIKGPVTAIESNGGYVFVVEQDVDTVGGIKSKLHRFTIGNNVGAMVGAYAKIAESGTDAITENAIFTGLELVTNVNANADTQRLILSTNDGLFVSDAVAGNVAWTRVQDTSAYHSIYTPKRTPTATAGADGVNHKVWGVKLADDSSNRDYYQNSAFDQFGFQGGNANATLQPATGYTDGAATNPLTYLDRTTSFWSDGARRLYTRFNANEAEYSTLHSFPYYAAEWDMQQPYSFGDLSSIPRIYWVENISGLGVVLAGTDNGVISLSE